VLKKLIFSPLVIAAIFFSSQDSKAEGGCPNGLYPAGGGYCRNIICVPEMSYDNQDKAAFETLMKYNKRCNGTSAYWGNLMVPKAK
jgi:hypothetical protein